MEKSQPEYKIKENGVQNMNSLTPRGAMYADVSPDWDRSSLPFHIRISEVPRTMQAIHSAKFGSTNPTGSGVKQWTVVFLTTTVTKRDDIQAPIKIQRAGQLTMSNDAISFWCDCRWPDVSISWSLRIFSTRNVPQADMDRVEHWKLDIIVEEKNPLVLLKNKGKRVSGGGAPSVLPAELQTPEQG